MTYQFKEAKDDIKSVLQGLTDPDGNIIFGTSGVICGKVAKLSLYQGKACIFGLGDSTKSSTPIGDRGSLTTDGLLIILVSGETEESIDTRELIITSFLDEMDTKPCTLPGLKVSLIKSNMIKRRTFNMNPEGTTPVLCSGAIIPLDVTLPNRKPTSV